VGVVKGAEPEASDGNDGAASKAGERFEETRRKWGTDQNRSALP